MLFRSAYNSHDTVVRALDVTEVIESVGSRVWERVYPSAPYSPLGIPEGEAERLPSLLVETEVERGIYGGKGDKKHLGGFTAYDGQGVSPAVWKHMITDFGVKSIMDVGCGKVCVRSCVCACVLVFKSRQTHESDRCLVL